MTLRLQWGSCSDQGLGSPGRAKGEHMFECRRGVPNPKYTRTLDC